MQHILNSLLFYACLVWLGSVNSLSAQSVAVIERDPVSNITLVMKGLHSSGGVVETESEEQLAESMMPSGQTIVLKLLTPRGFIEEGGDVFPGIGLKLTSAATGKILAEIPNIFLTSQGIDKDLLTSLTMSFDLDKNFKVGDVIDIEARFFDTKGAGEAFLRTRMLVVNELPHDDVHQTFEIEREKPGYIAKGLFANPEKSLFLLNGQEMSTIRVHGGDVLSFRASASDFQRTVGKSLPVRISLLNAEGNPVIDSQEELSAKASIEANVKFADSLPPGRYLCTVTAGNSASGILGGSVWVLYRGQLDINSEEYKKLEQEAVSYFAIAAEEAINARHLDVALETIHSHRGLTGETALNSLLLGRAYQLRTFGADAAMAYFQRAVELEPDNFNAWLALALSHKNARKYNSALEGFEKCVQINPNSYQANYEAGWICNELKDYPMALTYLAKAVSLNEAGISDPYRERITAYKGLKEYQNAAFDYEKLTALHPRDWEAFYQKGYNYIDAADYTAAIEALSRSLELYPDNPDVIYELAYSHKSKEEHAKANELFMKAIALMGDKNNNLKGRAYRHRGDCLHAMGDTGNACFSYKEANRLGATVAPEKMEAVNCK